MHLEKQTPLLGFSFSPFFLFVLCWLGCIALSPSIFLSNIINSIDRKRSALVDFCWSHNVKKYFEQFLDPKSNLDRSQNRINCSYSQTLSTCLPVSSVSYFLSYPAERNKQTDMGEPITPYDTQKKAPTGTEPVTFWLYIHCNPSATLVLVRAISVIWTHCGL